uniref:Prostaglandin-H2 D-isomerase n=1 Tax=Ornithorhynchus anatinus TaxID=9258 RepID=F7EJJ4_ORNAN
MKVQLLSFGLALICAIRAEKYYSFIDLQISENSELLGNWKSVGLATDCQFLEKMRNHIKIIPVIFTLVGDGNLDLTMVMRIKGGKCEEFQMHLDKTEQPGEFSVRGKGASVSFVEMSDSDHVIMICDGEHNGKKVKSAKLLSKSTSVDEDIVAEFKMFVENLGLSEDKIVFPTQIGKVPNVHNPQDPC